MSHQSGEAATVLVTDHGAVRILTLNRPEVRNAIDIPLRVELYEQLDIASRTADVRAIVITGAGGVFCSGGDVATMRRMPEGEARPRAESAQRIIHAIWSMPKPVIAAVERAAYGAGASLALACDHVVAGNDARISTSFSGVGLAGDMGIFASLPTRIGRARARQLMLFPRPVEATEAADIGMFDRVVDAGSALDEALIDAEKLARGPAEAIAVMKQMFSRPRPQSAETLALEVDNQVRLFDSDDFEEGVRAFNEKRRPVFGQHIDNSPQTQEPNCDNPRAMHTDEAKKEIS